MKTLQQPVMAGIYVSVLIACWGLDPGSKKAPEEGECPSKASNVTRGMVLHDHDHDHDHDDDDDDEDDDDDDDEDGDGDDDDDDDDDDGDDDDG